MSVLTDIARYLHDQVGEGNTFTRDQLAEVAGVSAYAAERRLRDLPKVGWKYYTVKNDTSLNVGEFRLVTIGTHVWEPGQQRSASSHPRVEDVGVENLLPDERATLMRWVRNGQPPTVARLAEAWRVYQRLSPAGQRKIKAQLFDLQEDDDE